MWLVSGPQKPPLKWHHRHKNPQNTTVQPQTPISPRDNRIRHLVKFTNSKQCASARSVATSFHCAYHTSSVIIFTVLISMSVATSFHCAYHTSSVIIFTILISMSLLRFKSLNRLGAKNREKSQHLNNLSQSNNSIILNNLNVTYQVWELL